jgi:protein-tyrosine phosphatase
MRRILFVCFGNICRSPMAEFIMKDLVKKRGLESGFHIESRGTSAAQLGNPVHPPARAELNRRGIDCAGKVSIRLKPEDYGAFDLLIAMDSMNVSGILRITGGDPDSKVRKMMEFSGGADVDDPWITLQYGVAFRDILAGCESWLERLAAQ